LGTAGALPKAHLAAADAWLYNELNFQGGSSGASSENLLPMKMEGMDPQPSAMQKLLAKLMQFLLSTW